MSATARAVVQTELLRDISKTFRSELYSRRLSTLISLEANQIKPPDHCRKQDEAGGHCMHG